MKKSEADKYLINSDEWWVLDDMGIKDVVSGDMPGDKVQINESHIEKAKCLFPKLLKMATTILMTSAHPKVVISVYGGSGVGKSEIGSLLNHYFNKMGIGSYVLSGDNYPRRIPKVNDEERRRCFHDVGLKSLIEAGDYTKERHMVLLELQEDDSDSNPDMVKEYPWLETYQSMGRKRLSEYLGTDQEIDFKELNAILEAFKNGVSEIFLKRMGREINELWYDAYDFSQIKILIVEWTHGNNERLSYIDIPVLLHSTPEETLAHRKARNRDGCIDSPFTTMVLEIEQELLQSQAKRAKLIVKKNGKMISFEEYKHLIG